MNYREIKIGGLYECTEILGIAIRDWNRSEPVPSSLKIECPILNNHDLFLVLEVTDVKKYEEVYDVKILSAEGNIGWLFFWKKYDFPAKEMVEIPKTV